MDPLTESAGPAAFKAPIIGWVFAVYSRTHIDAALRNAMMTRLVEILLLDGLLMIVLAISLPMVFKPIAQLQDALFDLAAHEGNDAKELPQARHRKFSEVIQGFNYTLRKLRQTLARSAQAEEAARVATARLK